jgi:hypothetical protein
VENDQADFLQVNISAHCVAWHHIGVDPELVVDVAAVVEDGEVYVAAGRVGQDKLGIRIVHDQPT